MKKTILIPTDFQVESLNTLKLALARNAGCQVSAVLLHSEHLGLSISDMLFYSPFRIVSDRITPPFREAMAMLQNRFSKAFEGYRIEMFHGFTDAAFGNFIAANGIDEIYVPKRYKLRLKGRSFDPGSFIKSCGLPVLEMDWDSSGNKPGSNQLDTLFNN